MKLLLSFALTALTLAALSPCQGTPAGSAVSDPHAPGSALAEGPPRYPERAPVATQARDRQPVEPLPFRPEVPASMVRPVAFDVATGVETIGSPIPPSALTGDLRESVAPPETAIEESVDSFGAAITTSPGSFPYSAQVRVFYTQGGVAFVASGTLVDPRTVLTAGHVVHQGNGGAWSTNVSVSPAWDGDDDHSGSSNGISLFSFTAWTGSGDANWNMGFIRLDRPVGALTGTLGYAWSVSSAFFTAGTFHHAAYPSCAARGSCVLSFAGCPNQLIRGSGPFDTVATDRLTMNLPNWNWTGGMDGGACFWVDQGSARIAYGVSASRREGSCAVTSNTFTRMTQPKFDYLDQTVIAGTYGASLDLTPLRVRSAAGSSLMQGGLLPSLSTVWFNNSEADPATATYPYEVRLSSNTIITVGDALLGTRSFQANFAPRGSAYFPAQQNLGERIPLSTSPGTYYVGVISTTNDADNTNNSSSGWDAWPIQVVARPAQAAYDPTIGTPEPGGVGDDQIITRNLGFPFRFPNGTTTTSIDIDSNGRILLPGTDPTDFSESVFELLSQAPSICALWNDIVPRGHTTTGNIYFRTTSTKAVITYQNARLFDGQGDFSFQVQLFANGHFAFIYDSRVDSEGIVGFSAGSGVTDPGNANLSLQRPIGWGAPAVLYEQFGTFDLADRSVQFTPDGHDGWIVSTGPANYPLPPAATNTYVGRSTITSIEFTPQTGGYSISNCANCFDTNPGTPLALGNDSMANDLPLGFSFPMPIGGFTGTISVDSNGRILTHSGVSMPQASTFQLLTETSLRPFHTDLDPSIGGTVEFFATSNYATVTWRDVPQRSSWVPITMQALLRDDGSFVFSYVDVPRFANEPALVGYSTSILQGGGTIPTTVDFSNLPATAGLTAYQFFNSAVAGDGDLQLDLSGTTTPVLNQSWNLRQTHLAPGTAASFLLLGFSNPNIDLTGLPGLGLDGALLLVNPAVPALPMTITGDSSSRSISIGTSVGLVGLPLFVQAINVSPNTTPLGAELSNGVMGVIGF